MSSKITIIGAGSVGSTIAYTLSNEDIASEIVLIDINKKKVEGEVMDIAQGTCFRDPVSIIAGEYEDAKDSDIVIITSVICYSLYPYELSSLLFIVFYLFFAFGQGFSMGTIMTNGLSQLPEELNADGNAAMNTLLQLAGAVGTAVISTIVATAQAAEPANITHATMLGSRHGFFVLTVSAVLILCCSLKVFALIKKKNPAHA